MTRKYKGTFGDLTAAFAFTLVAVLRLYVQFTSNFSTMQNIMNIIFVIISFFISFTFIRIYKSCVVVTDNEVIITETFGYTKIDLKLVNRTFLDKNKLRIYLDDGKEIRFQIHDLNRSDREDFMYLLSEQIKKNGYAL